MALTFQDPTRPMIATTGATRWNQTNNTMEVFDGAGWQTMAFDGVKEETMSNCIQVLEDQIAVRIEEEYTDNVTIQDAFKAWEEANERFRVILAIAEKK